MAVLAGYCNSEVSMWELVVGNGFFPAGSYWWIGDSPLQGFLEAPLLCEWETEIPGSFLQRCHQNPWK